MTASGDNLPEDPINNADAVSRQPAKAQPEQNQAALKLLGLTPGASEEQIKKLQSGKQQKLYLP